MRIKLTEYQIGCELWMLGYFNNPPEMFDPNLDHVVTINGQLLARTVHANARLGCVAYEFNGRIVVSWGRVLVIPAKIYRAAWPNSRAKSPPPLAPCKPLSPRRRDRIERLLINPFDSTVK